VLPDDLDGWAAYRVVILGDVLPDSLSAEQQQLLEQFVSQRGGTLVLIAGDQAMPQSYMGQPLEVLLPVEPDILPAASREHGYHLIVTPEGRSAPMTQLGEDELASSRLWREQYSGKFAVYDLSPFSRPKPATHVLIKAVPADQAMVADETDRTFLCWQRYGRGRVVYLAAPVTWRLRYRRGDRPHHLFWGQLLQWAVAEEIATGSKTVRLRTDKARYNSGDDVVATVRLTDLDGSEVSGATGRVIAELEDQIVASQEFEEMNELPGVYQAVLKSLPEGTLTITVTGTQSDRLLSEEGWVEPVETTVTIDPNASLEMRNTRCNLPLLKQIADRTGGAVISPAALAETAGQLDLAPEVTKQVRQVPVWPRWSCLWLFLGCLSTEWVIRKMTGMA
jgi:hypothetical protein